MVSSCRNGCLDDTLRDQMTHSTSIRSVPRLQAFMAAAVAVSMVGIAMGGGMAPIGGMGTAILSTVLGTVAVAESHRGTEQPLRGRADRCRGLFSIRPFGLERGSLLPVERHAGPARGNIPPPSC